MGLQTSLHTSLNTLRHACAMHAIDKQATLDVVCFIQRDHSQFLWQLIEG